jgi:BON domain
MNGIRQSTPKLLTSATRAPRVAVKAWWKSVTVATRVGWLRARVRAAPLRARRTTITAPEGPTLALAALAGAGIEYLLDPADGKRRRHVLRDRLKSATKRTARSGVQQARYYEGKATGMVKEATSAPAPPADDITLADRVRTEIFRRPDAPKDRVNVSVVDSIVYLRGELDRAEEIDQLVADARRVAGVRSVESLLHTPGTPAPTGGAG